MKVFRKSSMKDVSRAWRQVNMETVPGLSDLNISVDTACIPEPPTGKKDPMVTLFEFISSCMSKLGGAIPLIVENTLDGSWRQQLEVGIHHPLPLDKSDRSLSNLTRQLHGKKIYLFGDPRPAFIVPRAEGNASWTLKEEGFTCTAAQPQLEQAELLIFLTDLAKIRIAVDDDELSTFIVGRGLKFIHEITHGLRMLRRLSESWLFLTWTRNGDGDWCVDKSQFLSLLSIPPKFGNPTGKNKDSDYPTDAGRLWEHSITEGKAFFQQNIQVVVARESAQGQRVEYVSDRLSEAEAREVIKDPARLIQLSRGHAASVESDSSSRIVEYATPSLPVTDFQYVCSSSGWSMVNQQ